MYGPKNLYLDTKLESEFTENVVTSLTTLGKSCVAATFAKFHHIKAELLKSVVRFEINLDDNHFTGCTCVNIPDQNENLYVDTQVYIYTAGIDTKQELSVSGLIQLYNEAPL